MLPLLSVGDVLRKEGEVVIHASHLSDAEFLAFCENNPLLSIERDWERNIIVMPPADSFGDSRNAEFTTDLAVWNRALPTPGITFGPSAGFTLPSGVVKSPDGSWISAARWNAVPPALRAPFPHIAPDFIAEIMSPSDRLPKAQEKMEEFRAAGVRLGWLIDRTARTVSIYRADGSVETLDDPATVSGDPEMPGLVVDMARVFRQTL